MSGIPPKPANPKEFTTPTFPPSSAGTDTSQEVAGWTVSSNTMVSATITAGEAFFHVVSINVAEWQMQRIDPSELPHPSATPVFSWSLEDAGHSNGSPVAASTGQVVSVTVGIRFPAGAASGPVTGAVTIGSGPGARVIPLSGACIGLNLQSAIGIKYAALGGATFFGPSTSVAGPVPNNQGTMQRFTRGAIWDIPGHGTFFVTWQILAKWDDNSTAHTNTLQGDTIQHSLGVPVEDSFATAESGWAQRFTDGVIVARPNGHAFHVRGAIYACYNGLGDLRNPHRLPSVGWPTADEAADNPATARVSVFDGGEIHWSAATGAHAVQGAILALWRSAGLTTSFGLPVTNELVAADGAGRYSNFERGAIAWNPKFGAHQIPAPVAAVWHGTRGPSGWLGYPLSLSNWTHPTSKRAGQSVRFQYGSIGFTPQDAPLSTPDQQTFNAQVLTPSGTALGGTVSVTVRSDGTWEFHCHMHDSGADDYSFAVRVMLIAPSGTALALQASGSVEGHIIGGGGRDFNHDEVNAISDPAQASDIQVKQQIQFIHDNWPDVAAAKFSVAHSYQDTGILGSIETLVSNFAEWAIGAAVGGVPLATLVFLGSDLGKHLGVRVVGPGGLVGVIISGASVLVMGPLGFVVGTVAGIITDAAVKHRTPTNDEYAFANRIFKGTLPPQNQIYLTNIANPQTSNGYGRCFTVPNIDGSVLLNLGDACFNDPVHHSRPNYPRPGQVFIHELTHAWQIYHHTFLPGLLCDYITKKRTDVGTSDVYQYGTPDTAFGDFGLEQQAHIVDDWFGATRTAEYGHTASASPTDYEDFQDPFFHYIANNIWLGDTG